MKRINNNLGFSIVEMLVSTLLVIFLSALSYRVLQKQTNAQLTVMKAQKNNQVAKTALTRFKVDAGKVDPNWGRFGVAFVFPHQGYSFSDNYYLLSLNQKKKSTLNDGVTFLRRSSGDDRIYVPVTTKDRLCYPSNVTSDDMDLYNVQVPVDSIEKLAVHDWILAYQAGNYALGVITQIGTTTPLSQTNGRMTTTSADHASTQPFIQLRPPNANEMQANQLNFGTGTSTGFTIKPGVVPASFDLTGAFTKSSQDNGFCFEASKLNFQKIDSPVSYFVDYQTSDGLSKSSSNSYRLNSKTGEKIPMLVRAEYKNGNIQPEYLAPVEDVEILYDIKDGDSIAKDVGRQTGSDYLTDLSGDITGISRFLSTYKIVAMKMQVHSIVTNPSNEQEELRQTSQYKVAFDPTLQQDIYQDEIQVSSVVTQNLNTLPKTEGVANESIGKPAYIVTGNAHEVMLPVSTVEVNPDGSMGSQSQGRVYVYNSDGCSVNSSDHCQPSSESYIQFNLGSDTKFFPNSITQVQLLDGTRKIFIGGVGIHQASGSENRSPYVGIVTLGANETLASKLDSPVSGGMCNISGCQTVYLPTLGTGYDHLMDTANISVDPEDTSKFLIAPMTKSSGASSPSDIYKAQYDGSKYVVSTFATIPNVGDGKIVTALSDRPIKVGDFKYYAVCTSKNINSLCGGECIPSGLGAADNLDGLSLSKNQIYGEILLVRENTGLVGGINAVTLTKHNYMCSSLQVDDNNNLIVGGRLTVQPISYNNIKLAIQNPVVETKNFLYLDEAISVNGGRTMYADYFKVDPTILASGSNMWIGWLTGVGSAQFPDGTFGLVNGNKFRLAANYLDNTTGDIQEFSNAGISTISLAGMSDRVVASIETDPSNINNSIITASYTSRLTELPDLYIPGKFYTKPGAGRISPTPLPSLPPSMSESAWLALYQTILQPKSESGLNSQMPVLDSSYTEATSCSGTHPKTCQ